MHRRRSAPCGQYRLPQNADGRPRIQGTTFQSRPAFTDRDQVDPCIGEHPRHAARIVSHKNADSRPRIRDTTSRHGWLLLIAIRWICASANIRAMRPISSPTKNADGRPLAGSSRSAKDLWPPARLGRSASGRRVASLPIAIRWIRAPASIRAVGRYRLPQKTRMAVPSPAAADLPRISGLLHDSADSRPDVASHRSRTDGVGKSAPLEGCHRDARSRTGGDGRERRGASGPW